MTFGPIRSLGLRSDLMVMGARTVLADRGDHLVTRTPDEPDYWFGNAVILRGPEVDLDHTEALFRAAHPAARHRVVQWDDPLPARRAVTAALPDGWEVEETDVLTAAALRPVPAPDGYVLRPLADHGDWRQAEALARAIGVEQGDDDDRHAAFVAKRTAFARNVTAEGRGVRMGAFRDGALAAAAGIAWGDGLARYQDVETGLDHRRKGLAAALAGELAAESVRRAPGAVLVILADADADGPGRLYRRLGFRRSEGMLAAVRPG